MRSPPGQFSTAVVVGQLAANLQPGDEGRLETRTRGIDRGSIARRSTAENDDTVMPPLLSSILATAEQRIEPPGSVERRKIVEAADMLPVNEDLGYSLPPRSLDHLRLKDGAMCYVDLGELGAF